MAAEKNHDQQTNVTLLNMSKSSRIIPDVLYTLDDHDQDGTR